MPAKTMAAYRNDLGAGIVEFLRLIKGWYIVYDSTIRCGAKGHGASLRGLVFAGGRVGVATKPDLDFTGGN
jgi:hypothetical protein